MKPILILFLSCLYSCGSAEFKISAYHQDLNTDLMSLKTIDLRLLGANRTVQYFKVSGTDKLSSEAIESRLFAFADGFYTRAFSPNIEEINLLFYRVGFTDYSRAQLYHAALETEEGMVDNQKQNLIALIRLKKSKNGKWVRVYDGYSTQGDVSEGSDNSKDTTKQHQPKKESAQKFEATVENNNCLKVISGDYRLLVDKCFDVDFLRIRSADEKKISLTFISGKNAIDVDFYPASSGWVSKKISFFGATTRNKKGITQNRVINLQEFRFSTAAENLL